MNLKLELELLSDALPGSGESEAGIVDRDSLFDEYGLPYVLSKRLKGTKLTSAKDLADWEMLNNDVEKIFGAEGSLKTVFTISNGYIERYKIFRDFLNSCNKDQQLSKIFHKSVVQKYFSYNRTQTSVMRKIYVSKEKSLRISRVLKKGLKFYFDIDVDIEESEKEKFKEDIEKICKVTRNFGSSRTKGLGEISLKIIAQQTQNIPSEKVTFDEFNDEDYCVINLNLKNEEQLIVSNLINGQQTSEMLIRGSYILGAIARYYIQKRNLKIPAHEDPEFRKIFLSGNINFTNFYPSINEDIFYPIPFSIIREKGKERHYDLSYGPDLKTVVSRESGIQTEFVGGFSLIKSSKMQTLSLATKIESHNRRPRDRKIGHAIKNDDQPVDITGAYFHYDVLEPNFKFKGQIIGKYEDLKSLIDILPKKISINIGKSKTAQYGKCLLEVGSIDHYERTIQNNNAAVLVITLTSDMILMNESGYINPEVAILKEEIETALGINLSDTEIENSFLKFTKVGGFNSIWGLPKIQGQALAAGSVIVLKRKDNLKFNVGSLNKLALGLRTSEGYGQFAINTHGFSSIEMIEPKKENNESIELSLDLIQDFIKFCFKESLESAINEEVFRMISSKNYKNINISGSFLQRLLIFIKNSNSIDNFNENLKELKKKALNQLKKIEKALYIEDKTVNKAKFESLLETLSKKQIDFDNLKDENMKKSNLKNYFTRDLGELYKIYCRAFLTNLILKIRGSKNE
ncbi:hypothetical protein LCGC14_0654090 [marine sediment metagenome]|uniref:CRISPR-associated protein Csx10 n=1 Tax=marine sediment metagenome TaxID=412755 RepID=A0A0F9RFE6_9ZZZZ